MLVLRGIKNRRSCLKKVSLERERERDEGFLPILFSSNFSFVAVSELLTSGNWEQAGDTHAAEVHLSSAGISVEGFNRPLVSGFPAAAGPGYAGEAVPQMAPTSYLQVAGMVTPDVLMDDTEYEEVCLIACTRLSAERCRGRRL
jgi:hypothetical protein